MVTALVSSACCTLHRRCCSSVQYHFHLLQTAAHYNSITLASFFPLCQLHQSCRSSGQVVYLAFCILNPDRERLINLCIHGTRGGCCGGRVCGAPHNVVGARARYGPPPKPDLAAPPAKIVSHVVEIGRPASSSKLLDTAAALEGTWLHAGYHLTSGTTGPQIVSLPFAIAALGWGPGLLMLCLGGFVSFYAYRLQIISVNARAAELSGQRCQRFRDLAIQVLGEKWSTYLVATCAPPVHCVLCNCRLLYCAWWPNSQGYLPRAGAVPVPVHNSVWVLAHAIVPATYPTCTHSIISTFSPFSPPSPTASSSSTDPSLLPTQRVLIVHEKASYTLGPLP